MECHSSPPSAPCLVVVVSVWQASSKPWVGGRYCENTLALCRVQANVVCAMGWEVKGRGPPLPLGFCLNSKRSQHHTGAAPSVPCMKLHETVPWHLILLPRPLLTPPQGQASLAQSFFGQGPHEAQAWGLFGALSTPSL